MTQQNKSKVEEAFSAALHATARSWRMGLDARLKDLGVGQAGWMTIAVIAKADTALSQTELADRLGVEGPTVVAMLDRLARNGLVLRVPSPTDRRVKLLQLTEAGQALFGKVRAQAEVFRSSLLADVDEATLSAATAMLERLRGRIEDAL